MVICLERGANLHMAQLMPLPLTVSCFSKIQIGLTFLVPAHPGSPRKGPLNGCVCVCIHITYAMHVIYAGIFITFIAVVAVVFLIFQPIYYRVVNIRALSLKSPVIKMMITGIIFSC